MPEEGRALLWPLCPGGPGVHPHALAGYLELPAGHRHAAQAPTQPTTAQLHRPGGSDQSFCCPGQRTPGFVPLIAQTPSWWGHPVSPGCGDT